MYIDSDDPILELPLAEFEKLLRDHYDKQPPHLQLRTAVLLEHVEEMLHTVRDTPT